MLYRQTGFLLVTLISAEIAVPSKEHDVTEPQKPRQNCNTLVISMSTVIVNCSYSSLGHHDSHEVLDIDKRVTSLDLSWSKLKMISTLIQDKKKSFANLAYLNLSNNELSQHEDLKHILLQSVEHLDISNNQLSEFPPCSPGLVAVNLRFNTITNVDVSRDVSVCGKLKHLSLAENRIHDFRSSCGFTITNGFSLMTLDLSSNEIKELDSCAFKLFDRLLELNLSSNGVKHIPANIFKNLNLLEKLDLSHNFIEYIAPGSMEIMKELKFLDISHNKLKTLPNALPMTDWFDASFNMITNIPETFTSVLFPQSVFLLGGNPFICNCDLLWLKELFDTRKYLLKFMKNLNKTKFIPVCRGPDKIQGTSWDSLDDGAFECSGLQEEETKLIKENVEQVLAGKDLIEASEIGENFVMLKWNIPSDLSKSVELSYHRFGQKKDRKEVVLPSSVTSYRLKKLVSGAPYVICLKVTLTNELKDCIEIVTRVSEGSEWHFQITTGLHNMLSLCHARLDIFVLSVGLISILYFFFLREGNDPKAE